MKKIEWYARVLQWGKWFNKINIYNTWFNQIGRIEFDKHITDIYTFYLILREGNRWLFKGYDSYLKDLYGDYMQIPPEDERVPTHIK